MRLQDVERDNILRPGRGDRSRVEAGDLPDGIKQLPARQEHLVWAAQLACLLEISADKPGNVSRYRDFADTKFEDFLISAVAIAPAFRQAHRLGVGEIVLQAIQNTQKLVSSNTNLGIVLLFAPLAKAFLVWTETAPPTNLTLNKSKRHGLKSEDSGLRAHLAHILSSLSVEDARLAYRAIQMAGAGGLGKVEEEDISGEATVSLRQAMELAQERDSIAREYCTDFEITFTLGYPALMDFLAKGMTVEKAIVQTYLTILAQVPDTLIARRRGWDMAREISHRAQLVLSRGGLFSEEGRAESSRLDLFLRGEGNSLNPGTTADLATSSLFLTLLVEGYQLFGESSYTSSSRIP